MAKIEKRYPGTINVLHQGCWASDLSLFFIKDLHRPDLELDVSLRNISEKSYDILAIIRSRENKKITNEECLRMKLYLQAHDVVRIIQHVNKMESAIILYLIILDEKIKGVVRLLPPAAVTHPDVGMPVYNGVESLRAYYSTQEDFYQTVSKFISRGYTLSTFISKDREMGKENLGEPMVYPDGIVNDPYFIFNLLAPENLIGKEKKSQLVELLKAGKDKLVDLLDFLEKNMPWIYPILKKLIEIYQKIKPYYIG